MGQTRRLTAIMFTDIAGFTTMMGSDEKKGLELVHSNRSLQKPLIEQYDGRWLKEMGDGVLASFTSAYQAVKCAMDIQQSAKGLLKHRIRIGIHLGDVTIEGNDIFGDGVNIASRLESIADPGGIYISESIYKAIRSNKDINCQFIGELQLKNVVEKIGTYAILGEKISLPSIQKIRRLTKTKSLSRSSLFYMILLGALILGIWFSWNKNSVAIEGKINSMAVLPFDNNTGDPEQENMIAGLHDNLITALSRISSLRIISKTSTLKYKNDDLSIPDIASELGVDAIVESSVIKLGDSIRINVQLIQAFPKEQHLWANIFTRPLANIFDLYNDVTQSIADEIELILSPKELSLLSNANNVNPEAYKAYLKGQIYSEMLSPETLDIALGHFERSLAIDSSFAPAYAGIAFVWIVKLQFHLVSGSIAIPKIYSNNQKALDLDDTYPQSQYIKALMSAQAEWDWKKSETAFKKALEANPNHAMAHSYYSHILMFQNRFEEAIREGELAVTMDPNNPGVLGLFRIVLWHAGKIDEAKDISLKIKKLNPTDGLLDLVSESTYYLQGDYQKSFELIRKSYEKDSLFMTIVIKEFEVNGYNSAMEKWAKILEERFKVEQSNAFLIALYFNRAKKYDDALNWLEIGFDIHDVNMPYVFVTKEFNTIRSEPRWTELARKMNLPL